VVPHVERGERVTAVICSYGERHHPALFLDAEEAPGSPGPSSFQRVDGLEGVLAIKDEARRAAEILGIQELIFLG
jgi:LmbE family N-acetylglucosaminyl deacetylase